MAGPPPDLSTTFHAALPDALAAELDERLAVPIAVEARRANPALAEEFLAGHVAQFDDAKIREIEAAGSAPDFELVIEHLVPDLLSHIPIIPDRPPQTRPWRREHVGGSAE